jgi:multidrug resistance efflux pump
MSEAPPVDPIPSLAREVQRLFAESLADQRFGDLDASTLESLADRARSLSREVDQARATLEEARAALDEARAELSRRAEQALAYARIYATEDRALRDRLVAIDEARGGQVATRKPRRRGKASSPKEPQLPLGAEAAE